MMKRTKVDLEWNGLRLRRWRQEQQIPLDSACGRLGCSRATLYRWENGEVPPLHAANRIVSTTHGVIRYRDIYRSFRPEFA